MASQEIISAVVDIIVDAFGGDAELFQAFLVRSRLETELRALESQHRKTTAAFEQEQQDYNAATNANADARSAKQAEIDALEA